MKSLKHVVTAFFLTGILATPAAAAGWTHIGTVRRVAPLANGVELQTPTGTVRLEAVGESTIRVRLAPKGQFPADQSWAVLPEAGKETPVRVSDSREWVEFATPQITVRILKSPLRVIFLDPEGQVILEDHPALPMAWSEAGVRVWKSMAADEHYYGLGEKAGPLDKRNQAYTMWNTDAFGYQESTDPIYKSIPFFLALRNGKAYGIFFDNTYRSQFDFGKESEDYYSFGATGGEIDYYFFYGPHPKQVVQLYGELTGRMPMPPRWALGYQQCRYSYFPEARVREIAAIFRQKKIPADVLYLDIDYQKDNAPFTIDRERFPSFEDMINDITAQGFRFIAITDLHLKKEAGYEPYDRGLAGDMFVKNPDGSAYVGVVWPGESVFPDFTLTRAREFWGSLYKDFVDMGISGFWNDMNEPAIFQRADKTMPLDTVHRLDDGTTKDHRAIHNVFGMQNARATYEGLLKLRPNQRPFVLTRAGYAGTQRYAATWTGDNSSTWNHYRMTVPMLLGLGLSGYALVGNDVGGFAGSPTANLLTRWHQIAVFTPMYRNHTMKGSRDQEPWVHGPEHEAIRRRYIELRYQLLPYIYTVAEETARTGLPMMRPLFLEYPENQSTWGNEQQFLFGRDLLIAADLSESVDDYEFALPGAGWYDYWTGKRVQGKQVETNITTPEWVRAAAPAVVTLSPRLEEMPVFVRAGAIFAQQPIVQHTGEKPNGPLELRVYPGDDCSGSLYWDDGITFDYQKGEFLRVKYSCSSSSVAARPAGSSLQVSISAREGSFQPWWSAIRVEIYGTEVAPQEICATRGAAPGEAATQECATISGWAHQPERHNVTFTLPENRGGWSISVR